MERKSVPPLEEGGELIKIEALPLPPHLSRGVLSESTNTRNRGIKHMIYTYPSSASNLQRSASDNTLGPTHNLARALLPLDLRGYYFISQGALAHNERA